MLLARQSPCTAERTEYSLWAWVSEDEYTRLQAPDEQNTLEKEMQNIEIPQSSFDKARLLLDDDNLPAPGADHSTVPGAARSSNAGQAGQAAAVDLEEDATFSPGAIVNIQRLKPFPFLHTGVR